MYLRSNLEYLLKIKDSNPYRLQSETNIPQPTIQRILSGKTDNPRQETLKNLAAWSGVSVGDLLDKDLKNNSDDVDVFPRPASGENFAVIPYYDALASCGNGYFNDHIEIKNGLAFSRKWLSKRGLQESSLIIIGAHGDSMWPTFSNGATLLVNRAIDKPKSGKVYLITENGEERVKRLFQEFTGEWRIASDNPNKAVYPDAMITPEQMQSLKITGQVVWFDGEL